ncbi:MAG: hypothetical protein ACREL1_00160 [bacterium]
MEQTKAQISWVETLIGFLSFIPFLGFLFSLVSIVLGAVKFRAGGGNLILLGVLGFMANVGVYFLVLHFMIRGFAGTPSVNNELAQNNLRQTVLTLEFYKQVHGGYPADLKDLVLEKDQAGIGNVFLYDDSFGFSGGKLQFHQYRLSSDKKSYQLYDLGPDKTAGTADDIYPDLTSEEIAHSGYRPPSTPVPGQ